MGWIEIRNHSDTSSSLETIVLNCEICFFGFFYVISWNLFAWDLTAFWYATKRFGELVSQYLFSLLFF